jgi:hypothetical protein
MDLVATELWKLQTTRAHRPFFKMELGRAMQSQRLLSTINSDVDYVVVTDAD